MVLFCRQRQFLGVRFAVDPAAAAGGWRPGLDLEEVTAHLQGLARVAEGAPGAGAVAAMPQSERFGWLVAPASTVVQASEVHTGLCEEPAAHARRAVRAPGGLSASRRPAPQRTSRPTASISSAVLASRSGPACAPITQ